MKPDLTQLSRTLSYALRHKPHEFDLVPDEMGWVLLDDMIAALKKRDKIWEWIDEQIVHQVLQQSDKKRFEIHAGSIRAVYGHSLSNQRIRFDPTLPPEFLYHGTTENAARLIHEHGLQPMQRQYVHLSEDIETAVLVGKRRCRHPVILTIAALRAHNAGIQFYHANEKIWLADPVPSEYLVE